MKYYLFSISILLISCSGPQKPEFRGMEGLRVTSITTQEISIEGNAIYHNPNPVSCTIRASNIDVIVNNVNIGRIEQTLSSKIPAKSNFELPVFISFPPEKIFADGGLFGGLLSVLGDGMATIHYQGNFTLEVMGVEVKVPIEYKEKIPLKREKVES